MTSKKTNKESKPPEAPSVEAPPVVVKAPEAVTYTPDQYRAKFCMVKARGAMGGSTVSSQYAVAAGLFQWASQAHHYGADSFQLTQEEFEKALTSASRFPCAAPFSKAIPPVIKDKFSNFKPKKAAN